MQICAMPACVRFIKTIVSDFSSNVFKMHSKWYILCEINKINNLIKNAEKFRRTILFKECLKQRHLDKNVYSTEFIIILVGVTL